jgi:hypothetical protein
VPKVETNSNRQGMTILLVEQNALMALQVAYYPYTANELLSSLWSRMFNPVDEVPIAEKPAAPAPWRLRGRRLWGLTRRL